MPISPTPREIAELLPYLSPQERAELDRLLATDTAWRPQPGPQTEAINQRQITEIFFGGAVGGGKSDFLLGDFAQDVNEPWGRWCRGILFRRTYGELEELIERSQEIYRPWFPGIEWTDKSKSWVWPNGARLKLRYLEHATDWTRYWGHAYTWIGWDELPLWPNMMAYSKLMARLRSAHPVPNKRVRATGNPGGAGHQAVKAYFGIDRHPMGGVVIRDEEAGTTRLFIRSRLQDNRILLDHDPGYVSRLQRLGSAELVKAWVEGNWDVIAGAYFDCWSAERHVIKPFAIPRHWMKFGSFDWGSAKPFSMGWWAISDGSVLPDGRRYPTGAMIRYREWYGASEPNVGLKMRTDEIAAGIKRREAGEDISYRVADPACWDSSRGPSIAEQMATSESKVMFRPADNKRIAGWSQMRDRLVGEEAPMLYCFDTCTDFIRTVPALQHDGAKPEDLDSDGEDHAADDGRYACMSRPYTRKAPSNEPIRGVQQMTMEEAWKLGRIKQQDNPRI